MITLNHSTNTENSSTKGTIAIIGAGSSGLATAKFALQNGLTPSVFDKASEIGGMWAKGTPAWENLHLNTSRLINAFSDHPWPKGSPMFPSKQQMHDYLVSYIDRFNVTPHIYLNKGIKNAKPIQDENGATKWQLKFENGETQVFDFCAIASGLYTKPKIPAFKNIELFEGIKMHSSKFQLNHPDLKDKKVVVIGACYSAVDISANLVGHSKEVVNIFTRPYLVVPRLVPIENKIWTIDMVDYTRANEHALKNDAERRFFFDFLKKLFPQQTDKELAHPALYIDLDQMHTQNRELVVSISDTYIEKVNAGKITPIQSGIQELTRDGLILENGEFVLADVILFSTGYDCSVINYLEKSVIDKFRVENNYTKFQYALGKFTFHPDLDNLALIGQVEGLYWNGCELQGKLTSLVFSGKMKVEKADMRKEIEEIKQRIVLKRKEQFPYGSHPEICDTLAREMNLLPDLDELKRTEPNLYKMFWNNVSVSANWLYKENRELCVSVMKNVDLLYNQEYDFGKSASQMTSAEIVDQFKKHFVYQ